MKENTKRWKWTVRSQKNLKPNARLFWNLNVTSRILTSATCATSKLLSTQNTYPKSHKHQQWGKWHTRYDNALYWIWVQPKHMEKETTNSNNGQSSPPERRCWLFSCQSLSEPWWAFVVEEKRPTSKARQPHNPQVQHCCWSQLVTRSPKQWWSWRY